MLVHNFFSYISKVAISFFKFWYIKNQDHSKIIIESKLVIEKPEILEKSLTQSNTALGILAKERHLFIHVRTRTHLDKIKDLGNFMEFEVRLLPTQTFQQGQAEAEELMKFFNIKGEDLMTGPYFDEFKM